MRTGAVRGAVMTALVAGVMVGTPARAATLTVTTTQDEVDPNNHACSLREAVMVADNPGNTMDCSPAPQSEANTIVLGPHTYTLTIPHASDDGSSGHLAMFTIRTLTIQGAGPTTVIDASGLHDRIVTVSPGASASIRDLTITGGHAPAGATGSVGTAGTPTVNGGPGGTGTDGGNGGGIENLGTLSLDHITATGNHAGDGGAGGSGGQGGDAFASIGGNGGRGGKGGSGGGIYNEGQLTVIDSTITANHAGTGGAGGLGGPVGTPAGYLGGNGGPGGSGGDGGGIASATSSATLTVIGSTIDENFAGSGGAGGNGGIPLDMVMGATHKGGGGGAGADGSWGGGISDVSGAIAVTNSTITANTAGDGGAAGSGAIGWPLSLMNLGNPGSYGAGGNGGGVRITAPAGASLASDTIASNVAPAPMFETPGQGGGIWEQSPVTLTNTLLASNSPGGNCGTNSGTVASQFLGGHDLSFGDSTCPASFATGDPKLAPLRDNGGATMTMAIGAGGAAVDQGAGCPATDQRGALRPGGTACDIGAYELAPPIVPDPSAASITKSTATLSATVTAEAPDATVRFEFGTTTSYGSTATAPDVAGFSAQPVSAAIQGLTPGTTYHFRVVASSSDGTTNSRDKTFTTVSNPPPALQLTPQLSKLKLKANKFRAPARKKHGKAPKSGTTLSYIDSARATTTFTVFKKQPGIKRHGKCVKPSKHVHGGKCSRLVSVLRFSHNDAAGSNSLRFNPRLAPGNYVLQATPRLHGLAGRTVSVTFTIQKPTA